MDMATSLSVSDRDVMVRPPRNRRRTRTSDVMKTEVLAEMEPDDSTICCCKEEKPERQYNARSVRHGTTLTVQK